MTKPFALQPEPSVYSKLIERKDKMPALQHDIWQKFYIAKIPYLKRIAMKVFILTISLAIVAAKECTKTKPVATATVPSCIRQKIDSIEAQPKWNPPAEVYEYSYNGKTVYYFSSNCCDQYNAIYDSDCNYICAPSGGMTGKGDRKCPDFDATAKKIKLVWKDSR